MHPCIFSTNYPIQVHSRAGANHSLLWGRCKVHPGPVTRLSQGQYNAIIYKIIFCAFIDISHVFAAFSDKV